MFFIVFLSVFLFLKLVAGSPNKSTEKACSEIAKSLPNLVDFPSNQDFNSKTNAYWSTLLRDLKPACVVVPESATDVAIAVKTLYKYPDVNFTAKSGGHDPNVGHATVQDGVLISFSAMKGAIYDASREVAYVKPGGEWNDVITDLYESGVTVVGGRLGIVGVGGLLLQGGLSFLSAQFGLAADAKYSGLGGSNPNGTIVNVDAATQPELAVAMRGSGSQFGIVTQFTIRTYPIGNVWGGMRIYESSKADQIFSCLHEFIPYNKEDKKAAIIISTDFAIRNTTLFIIFYFYDDENPPTSGPFSDFLEIEALISETKTQSYPDLLQANGASAALLQSRISFRSITIPYIPNNPNVYHEITDKMREVTEVYFQNFFNLASECSIDFQPFPAIIGEQTELRGGNAMGLGGSDADRIILEIQCAWTDEQYDAVMPQYSRDLTDWVQGEIPAWLGTDGSNGDIYLPLFMNDAMGDQNVTGSYRNYAQLKSLQEQVDPEGILRGRTGGFKY